MELYEENLEEKTKTKLPMIIGICLGVLVIISIIIIIGILYLKSTVITINVDGNKNSDIEEILYIEENEEDKNLYIPIRKIAKFLNYEDYRGDYKNKSEDETKCYVKNEYEIAMFSLDSDVLIKTRGDSDYEYVKLDEKVFEKDGELYTTPQGIEQAFNVLFEYDLNQRLINIYTMNYLNQFYASKLKIDEYAPDPQNTEVISEEFSDQKAIFENMIVISKDELYGVLQATTGQSVLETKYEEIKYLPATSDFLVKSNGKYGVLSKSASVKVRIAYDEIKIMDNQNGLYLVKQNNLYGVVNTNGEVIIQPEYKQIGIDNLDKYAMNGVENQYVLMDEIIPIKNSNNLWGIFNIKGEMIKDFEFSGVGCTSTDANNSYPAIVIPSYKILIVEKDKHYNLLTTEGEELIPSYILEAIYLKSDTSTGENKFYMAYNNYQKVMSVEEWLTSIGR